MKSFVSYATFFKKKFLNEIVTFQISLKGHYAVWEKKSKLQNEF